jgi:hypothetical protein
MAIVIVNEQPTTEGTTKGRAFLRENTHVISSFHEKVKGNITQSTFFF